MMTNKLKKESGSILLYSLLIISLLSAISITVSFIVVNELELTRGASYGTMAYYAAEAGLEKGLYTLKVMRTNETTKLADALLAIQSFNSNDFDNGASFTDEGTVSRLSTVVNRHLAENEIAQIDYYDVNDPLDKDLAPPNPNVIVSSIRIVNNGNDPFSWADVSWQAWDSNGKLGTSTSARKFIGPTDLADPGWPINLDVFSSDPENPITPVGYRVRIRAFNPSPGSGEAGDLSDLTVTAYTTPNGIGSQLGQENLPSQLVIKSVGKKVNFKQALTATVPWKLPLYGLYNYVLFSEDNLSKTTILSSPTYSSGIIQVEASLDSSEECPDTCDPDSVDCCNSCQVLGWDGLECISPSTLLYSKVACSGSNGICTLNADNSQWGFVLPVPQKVPAGDKYYISLRLNYANRTNCGASGCGRQLSVEINGQSSVVDDPGDDAWHTCTLPVSFILGDPDLPVNDPSRTVSISINPLLVPGPNTGWDSGEFVDIDWYQLSTYKIFSDCP